MEVVLNQVDLHLLSAVVLGLDSVLALPGLHAAIIERRHRKPSDNWYEDRDGRSTPESVAAYSSSKQKLALLTLAVTGLGTSTTASVLSARSDRYLTLWWVPAIWLAIFLQAASIAVQRSPVKIYNAGFLTSISAVAVSLVVFINAYRLRDWSPSFPTDSVFPLLVVNGVNCLCIFVVGLSLPRRPGVFHLGQHVSEERTVSALTRWTWSWVGPLIHTARRKGDLEAEDVPVIEKHVRAAGLVSSWATANRHCGLLKSLLLAYWKPLTLLWISVILRSVWGIGPFWVMLQLVQQLERHDSGDAMSAGVWVLAFMIGFFTLTDQWFGGWIMWYSIRKIFGPMRSQLSALVFEKVLRRDNVKMAEESPQSLPGAETRRKKNGQSQQREGDSVLKSRQSIVNLVGVDVKHVSDFAMMQILMFGSAGKLVIYSAYQISLIGLIPFGAGLLAWTLILPINMIASRYYIGAQTKLMKERDTKLSVVNEVLAGLRQIKSSALETQWEDRILHQREAEIRTLKRVFIANTFLFFCWVSSPIVLSAVSLTVYAKLHAQLAPSVAFVSIAIWKSLEIALAALPELLTSGFDTLVSVRRLDTFLKGKEKNETITPGTSIAFDHATLAWPVNRLPNDKAESSSKDHFTLKDVSLSFPEGKLSVIHGKTGTGKSLLLNALIGEAHLLSGVITMPKQSYNHSSSHFDDAEAHPGNWMQAGRIAYVSQTPWLENASLRDNILFGLPYIESRYHKVVAACALTQDVKILEDGDRTEIGANGVNLSGGQKWRVTLARAVYSRATILIMDDIFSAVDAHVGRHILQQCITGDVCQGRTRIVVTHHISLLRGRVQYAVELGNGFVARAEVLAGDPDSPSADTESTFSVSRQGSSRVEESNEISHEDSPETEKKARKFVIDETREKGSVKRRVYGTIMHNGGGWLAWVVLVVLFAAFETANLGRGWWVQVWTRSSEQSTGSKNLAWSFSLDQVILHASKSSLVVADAAASVPSHDFWYYMKIYIALCGAGAFIGTLRFLYSFIVSIKNSRKIFQGILYTILRTPLQWIDTVPIGRILNRLTTDFDIIDNKLIMDIGLMFSRALELLGICVAAVLVSTLTLPLAGALILISIVVARSFLLAARPVKRLESTARSPLFDIFNAALAGVSTLRAYQKTQDYTERMYSCLDHWITMTLHNWALSQWLSVRMTMIGSAFVTLVALVTVGLPYIDASMAGFSLSFALSFSQAIANAVRGYATMELDMNAAERVVEYSVVPTEDLGGIEPPAAWPTSGKMQVEDLSVAYADDLPAVLKNLSFEINDRERIGIVGRTGAGKSSFTLALFRFLKARTGRVIIDGIDVSKMTLQGLRSRLAIIPQDPVLFSGTVRSNLDPFSKHSDAELYDCLSRVRFPDSTSISTTAVPSGANLKGSDALHNLEDPIAESGGNLSHGQRQLLCIARAIVSRPKVIVLDEATSAVDMATDQLIQRSIREGFKDSTLIVIAHRLSTIVDFDRVLVLEEGRVVEFGTPRELWADEAGVFRGMCEQSGEVARLREMILGD